MYPFVVCTSVGGPYDDDAFVAGAQCAEIDNILERAADIGAFALSKYVHTKLVPQLDLIAMHYGYTMTSEPWPEDPEGWALVTFTRSYASPPGVTQR